MRLTTHLRRSVFALPLLAVAVASLSGLDRPDVPVFQAWQPASDDCAAPPRSVGADGLARMPGDLGQLNRRLRCAI